MLLWFCSVGIIQGEFSSRIAMNIILCDQCIIIEKLNFLIKGQGNHIQIYSWADC